MRRWVRSFVYCLPICPPPSLLSSGAWREALLFYVAPTSFMLALGEYGYFHVFGGTDDDYPFPKTPGPGANK